MTSPAWIDLANAQRIRTNPNLPDTDAWWNWQSRMVNQCPLDQPLPKEVVFGTLPTCHNRAHLIWEARGNEVNTDDN